MASQSCCKAHITILKEVCPSGCDIKERSGGDWLVKWHKSLWQTLPLNSWAFTDCSLTSVTNQCTSCMPQPIIKKFSVPITQEFVLKEVNLWGPTILRSFLQEHSTISKCFSFSLSNNRNCRADTLVNKFEIKLITPICCSGSHMHEA